MKKMTKLAVTVAAMSAMTIAAATMVSADGKYNSIANEKPATGISDGEWGGNNADGWTFTADSKKVTGWNQIDGVWYYFHKDGIMAREELVYLNGHTYYFNTDGSMMANGWVAFDHDSEILYDYNLDIDENIEDINNPVFKNKEDAYDTVWMFFNGDGTAKDDEWYQADSGLWFYFDDIIMACGDFDHEIGNSYYGFDENGYMLVGWAENFNDKYLQAPNKDEKTWYWYESSGKKFDASDNNKTSTNFAWKKIGSDWYCFYDQSVGRVNADTTINDGKYFSVGTLITNTYFQNTVAGTSDYYYVDKTGAMATGVTVVDKDAQFFDDANYDFTVDKDLGDFTIEDENWEIYFDNNGKAKKDSWSGDRFYAAEGSNKVYLFDDSSVDDDHKVSDIFATSSYDGSYAVTGYTCDLVRGALVKNAFINKDKETYYVDKYGDKVKSSAVQVGYVSVTQERDSKNKLIDEYTLNGFSLLEDESLLDVNNDGTPDADTFIYRAYLVFDSKGIAYDDVDKDRTVTVGAKKYFSTDEAYSQIITTNAEGITFTDVPGNATLFFYKNKN